MASTAKQESLPWLVPVKALIVNPQNAVVLANDAA